MIAIEPSPPPLRSPESRNAEIWRRHLAGDSLSLLAGTYRVSRARIVAIVQAEARRRVRHAAEVDDLARDLRLPGLSALARRILAEELESRRIDRLLGLSE